ncbi:MAG: hypothetical protein JO356_06950, partial [Acidobacteria bacterium]|nr:hypothetical protein [Acidobacteriota bacterium]
ADFRRERERLTEACGKFTIGVIVKCAYPLFTDHPLHIAAGSLPPQNGFGLGPAFVTSWNTENWRLGWDADAVVATSGGWRAGAYMKLIHTPAQRIRVVSDNHPTSGKTSLAVHPYTVFNIYIQAISLNKINFFGLGNTTTLAGASVFGMRQTIIGGNVIKPLFEWPSIRKLNLAFLGELNGRLVAIRGEHGQSVPSIEALYTNATAPALASQPGVIQFGEGLHLSPALWSDHLHLSYLINFQQFVAASNSHYSFIRWTLDLGHTIPLYSHTASYASTDTKGPDECASGAEKCPPLSFSRNLQGAIALRLLLVQSITSATSAVPFYFQPTLGGMDLNSALTLGSYQDYRFRAPNLLLLEESLEHSIWGPFGLKLMADQGKVALTRGDLGFSHFRHSFAAGFTLRAGAFPMVSLMFAWGGPEGHHNLFNMNTSLLGGSSRPSLY